jgi:hypothetical protein
LDDKRIALCVALCHRGRPRTLQVKRSVGILRGFSGRARYSGGTFQGGLLECRRRPCDVVCDQNNTRTRHDLFSNITGPYSRDIFPRASASGVGADRWSSRRSQRATRIVLDPADMKTPGVDLCRRHQTPSRLVGSCDGDDPAGRMVFEKWYPLDEGSASLEPPATLYPPPGWVASDRIWGRSLLTPVFMPIGLWRCEVCPR